MENIKIHKGENLQENNFRGVYLIRNLDNDLLKIGRCNNLARRFKEIVKSFNFCGVEPRLTIECFLEYDYEIDLELYLHEQFDDVREQNEWFKINDIETVLEKLTDFKKKERAKKENKKNKIKIKHKKERYIEEKKEMEEYHYFEFIDVYSKRDKVTRMTWRSKILDIGILEKKVSEIMKCNYDIYNITMFYEGDIIEHEIIPDESILNAFEEKNTDCVVEVYKINKWTEEIEDEYGDIEVAEHSEDVLVGVFDYYMYLYEDRVKLLYDNIVYCKEYMRIINDETLYEIKERCSLLEEDVLEYLRKESKKYSKMYKVFNNPDIEHLY